MKKTKIFPIFFAIFVVTTNCQNDRQNRRNNSNRRKSIGLQCKAAKPGESFPSTPCIFPFKYEGKKYNGCIKQDSNQRWCAIEVDNRGNLVEGESGKGFCAPWCPKHKRQRKH